MGKQASSELMAVSLYKALKHHACFSQGTKGMEVTEINILTKMAALEDGHYGIIPWQGHFSLKTLSSQGKFPGISQPGTGNPVGE